MSKKPDIMSMSEEEYTDWLSQSVSTLEGQIGRHREVANHLAMSLEKLKGIFKEQLEHTYHPDYNKGRAVYYESEEVKEANKALADYRALADEERAEKTNPTHVEIKNPSPYWRPDPNDMTMEQAAEEV